MELPNTGKSRSEIQELLSAARVGDVRWRDGRMWSLVYFAGDDVYELAKEAYTAYFSENGLGKKAFPSLARFEREVISMVGALLCNPAAAGAITSGGSESILMAVKTARDRARAERGITAPDMVLATTAHPAFEKAAHYFGVKSVRTNVRDDFRADVAAMRAAINERTALVVGSAPQWPHGVIDPIPEIAELARERGLSFHVDACVGGLLLPFLRKLGHSLPPFDFSVPGVTSMSADLHKYGFTAKGASLVLYRDESIYRYQPFSYDWPGGTYASPTMAGTRPGGAIAAAWAVMQYLGQDGYLRLAERTMKATQALIEGIDAIEGLRVLGHPDMSVFAYGGRSLDIFAVADGLADRGWYVNRQDRPPGIHLKVDPTQDAVVEAYLADLRAVVQQVAMGHLTSRGSEVRYA